MWAPVAMWQVRLRTAISHTRTHTHLTALWPGLPGWAGTRKAKQIWIFLKQETVAPAGPYASLHLAPCQHPITLFLQAGCPSCHPINSIKAQGHNTDISVYFILHVHRAPIIFESTYCDKVTRWDIHMHAFYFTLPVSHTGMKFQSLGQGKQSQCVKNQLNHLHSTAISIKRLNCDRQIDRNRVDS